ncbi:MAG: hypothetical protein P8H59_05060 [Flavobacteriales bacterium]|nr:hypothetical protein [Flavobacteriales bacterium]MDG1780301.1 hypothetical protein [Flavobacteriales bacterium]MDG2247098.1 hypothetical protein [Flavobacteriales bacterium]
MKFAKYLISFFIAVIACSACGTSNSMSSKDQQVNITSDVQSFESQVVFPGVQSNLISTCNYILKMQLTVSDSVQVTALHTNSFRLPLQYVMADEQRISVQNDFIGGDIKNLVVHARRNNYNDEGPQVSSPERYEESIKDTSEKAYLELMKNGEIYYVELPKATELERIYAP